MLGKSRTVIIVGGRHSCEKAGVVQRFASKVMVAWGVKGRDCSWWKLKPRFASFLESFRKHLYYQEG